MRSFCCAGAFGGALLAFVLAPAICAAQGTTRTGAPAAAAAQASGPEQAVRLAVGKLIESLNAGVAPEVGKLFAEQAEFEDEAGTVHAGRPAIEELTTSFVERFPGAKTTAEIESVRLVTPQLALVEALRTTSTADGAEEAQTRASLTLIEQGGQWLVAAVREIPAEVELAPHDRLEPLAWLVGDWIDEAADSTVEINCRWSEDGNYLLVEHHTKIGGETALKTSQRLGWDPLKEQVHSWMFDSDGGYGDGEWTRNGQTWNIKSTAVLPDGSTGSAIFTIVPSSKPGEPVDKFVMKATHRVVADAAEPDREVTVVRRPPASKPSR